ncbi:MAG: hypothetical protein SFY66_19560 [Oculatellaceae cyanobacterium bins.114]|nr:hypothetical protein [Oculatellaceae cyanobacterium bins.114]
MKQPEPLVFNPADEALYYRSSAPKGCIPLALEQLQKVRAIAGTNVKVICSGNSILVSGDQHRLMVRVPDELRSAAIDFARFFDGVLVEGEVKL